MLLLDLYNSRPLGAELLGLLLAFAIGMVWAWITERRKRRMKDRIDRAVATLRGYCGKVNCGNCRYRTKDNGCHLQEDAPCDWDPERWQKEREETGNG